MPKSRSHANVAGRNLVFDLHFGIAEPSLLPLPHYVPRLQITHQRLGKLTFSFLKHASPPVRNKTKSSKVTYCFPPWPVVTTKSPSLPGKMNLRKDEGIRSTSSKLLDFTPSSPPDSRAESPSLHRIQSENGKNHSKVSGKHEFSGRKNTINPP